MQLVPPPLLELCAVPLPLLVAPLLLEVCPPVPLAPALVLDEDEGTARTPGAAAVAAAAACGNERNERDERKRPGVSLLQGHLNSSTMKTSQRRTARKAKARR